MNLSTGFDDLWQVISDSTLDNTNCIMPKYLLKKAIDANIKLPLYFKVTNAETNRYAICAAENFFDTENKEQLAILPSIIINYLEVTDLVFIEMINQSPDLIPQKAKTVFLEPQDELFYSIDNPEALLEHCFQKSYFLGKDYLIPLPINGQKINVKINLLANDKGEELKFGNINNIDLNVEFVPLPSHLKTNKIVRKPNPEPTPIVEPEPTSNSDESSWASLPKPSISTKPTEKPKWTPFGGGGYRLADGVVINNSNPK